MVWKGSQVPHDEVDCRDEKDNQGVGDFRFINTLQLSFFYLLLLIIFYFIFFIYTFFFTHDIYPTTHDQRHLATLSGNIEL